MGDQARATEAPRPDDLRRGSGEPDSTIRSIGGLRSDQYGYSGYLLIASEDELPLVLERSGAGEAAGRRGCAAVPGGMAG